MRIAIDISQIIYGTGVSFYTDNLVRSLINLDKENKYILFGGSLRRHNELRELASGFGTENKIFLIPPTLADIIWNRLHVLPIERLIGKIDVFHSSDWSQPPSKAFKVTTVHDLSPLKFPKDTDSKVKRAHEDRLKWVSKEVDRIISPSEATKADLIELGFDEERIRVIYEGIREIFNSTDKERVDEIKRKYNLSDKYLLAVGTSPRKNVERIIKAFELVRPGNDLKLVVVGEISYLKLDISETRNIRVLGHVPDEELPVFYSGAEVLVYPSLYEGFGIPILEAFSSRCPVVTSNVSSMPEIAGGAAVLVDPYSVDSIVEGIKEALKNKNELIEKGKVRVKDFSWEKTARETLKVYLEARG